MKTIRSGENRIYKDALKLLQRKYRDRSARYIIEGVKPVEDALDAGQSIEHIFILEGSGYENRGYPVPTAVLDRKLFRNISDTENTQGIVAVAKKGCLDMKGFSERVLDKKGNVVILDRLQDPGNVGTIIRTAEAAGYSGVMLVRGTADVYSQKAARAAAGSLFRVPVLQGAEEEEIIETVRASGRRLTVTCIDAELCCWDADMRENIALVIGNEGRGVSRGFIEKSDIKIKIPMAGRIESLNAAVAAGILMYQSQKTNDMRGKSYASSTE